MWTANLNAKNERTDGGVEFLITFTDGTRKFEKTLTFFGQFDLSQAMKNEINSIQALYTAVDEIELGEIVIPAEKPVEKSQTAIEIQTLRKLQGAAALGLVSDAEVTAQADVVKQTPDFLDFF